MVPIQPGELPATYADHRLLEALTDYRPQTSVETGVSRFVEWYVNEYCALTMNEAAYA
jgi:UDP-glucuronate 4-epimerase